MLAFNTHFWGERNNGFDILYHNMKGGLNSSKEFEEYIRESCNVEESYVKFQVKLAKMATNYGNRGSFGPFWQVFKTLAEKLASVHQQLSSTWQDVIKDIHKYTLEQQKKHKEVKDQECSTVDTVHCIQQTIVALQKAKETYHARCFDCEKLKRENASAKDIERAETKTKKAHEDYKVLLEKYANARNDFDIGMTSACIRFQEVEEKHLQQMKSFVDSYIKACDNQYNHLGQVYDQLRISCDDLSVSKLINILIQNKGTGTEKPGSIDFVEADLSILAAFNSSTEGDKSQTTTSAEKSKNQISGILSIPTKYRKKLNQKNNNPDVPVKDLHLIDADGFSIPPENVLQNNVNRESSSTSSDSDEDSFDRTNKIKLEIKPKSLPSKTDNLENIRDVVKNFKLSSDVTLRKTPIPDASRSCLNGISSSPTSASHDLINLDFGILNQTNSLQADASRITSPDIVSLTSAVIQSPTQPHPATTIQTLPFQTIPPPISIRTSNTSLPLIPTARPAGRQTPDLFKLERGESMMSLVELNNGIGAFGMSRGASPLTLGLHDTIPIAIAFSETVNAIFKPNISPIHRITGEMIVSFPCAIIKMLIENPNPAQLSFTIKNVSNIEQIKINKPLITELINDSSDLRYSFEMSALVEHLKKQTELNKNAAYFNIDILKYQLKACAMNLPFDLFSTCDCQMDETIFVLDFKNTYNTDGHASLGCHHSTVQALISLDADVLEMQSTPIGIWMPDKKRALWKLNTQTDPCNSINATFKIINGPSPAAVAALQFLFEGRTISGIDFELCNVGYRVSLVKKRIVSGKYTCDSQ